MPTSTGLEVSSNGGSRSGAKRSARFMSSERHRGMVKPSGGEKSRSAIAKFALSIDDEPREPRERPPRNVVLRRPPPLASHNSGRLCQASSCCGAANQVMLFGHGISGSREGLLDQAVRIEIDLPVVFIVAIGTNRKHRPGQVESQNLHVRGGTRHYIWNTSERLLQQGHRCMHIHAVRQLRSEFDSAVWIGGEVLNDIAKDLGIANDIANIVQGINGAGEQTNLVHRARYAASGDEIAHLQRLKNHEKYSGREIGQQPAPCHADRNAGGSDQGGKARCLHPEEAEDGNHKDDVQQRSYRILYVTNDGGINLLFRHRAADDAQGERNQPAAYDP